MVATVEPLQIVAGDSASWQISLPQYSASDGWALSYALRSQTGKIDIAASGSGAEHLVALAAATTLAYAPGIYSWQSYATRGGERVTVRTGAITVAPNFAATNSYDARTFAQRMLDAVEAALQTRATADQLDLIESHYSDITVRTDKSALLKMRDTFRDEVERERRAAAIASGMGGVPGRVVIRA